MDEEVERRSGVSVGDFELLESIAGRAPRTARTNLALCFRHRFRRGPDLRVARQRHPESICSVRRDFRFTFNHGYCPSQAKAFPGTLAGVTRARAPRPFRFWMSFDPAPTLLCARKSGTVGSLCDSRADFFCDCQYMRSDIRGAVCITWISQGAGSILFSVTLRRGARRSLPL